MKTRRCASMVLVACTVIAAALMRANATIEARARIPQRAYHAIITRAAGTPCRCSGGSDRPLTAWASGAEVETSWRCSSTSPSNELSHPPAVGRATARDPRAIVVRLQVPSKRHSHAALSVCLDSRVRSVTTRDGEVEECSAACPASGCRTDAPDVVILEGGTYRPTRSPGSKASSRQQDVAPLAGA